MYTEQPELIKRSKVPIYLGMGETVKIKGTGNQEWCGKVNNVNVPGKKA